MTSGIFFDIMILYNWKKIKREANSKVSDILTILHILTYRLPPVNKNDRIYKYWQKSFHGTSFLVNPEPLFIQRRLYSDKEIAAIEHWLNHTPRKCLGYKTPYEVMLENNLLLLPTSPSS